MDLRKRYKRDWSDMLLDPLILVARKLESVQDYMAFRGVCKSWRLAATTYEDSEWSLRLPFLVQAKNEKIVFSNPLAIQHQLPLPGISNTITDMNEVQICVGCKGWILVVQKNGNMKLVHIVSGVYIRLPNHEKSHSSSYHGIYKMVLSSSPLTSPYNFTLMIVYCYGKAAYWMPGDENFTEIQSWRFFDVMYSKKAGCFYGLNLTGSIVSIGRSATALVEKGLHTLVEIRNMDKLSYVSTFLVESDGDALLVILIRSITQFRVFKIEELDGKDFGGTEIKNLGNRAIFVGCFSPSIAVKASEIPGCKRNCIYFAGYGQKCTESNEEKYHMGVYNLADGFVEYFGCSGTLSTESCTCYCPPLWVTPTIV